MKTAARLTLLLFIASTGFTGCSKGGGEGAKFKCQGQLKQLHMALVQYKTKRAGYPAKDGEAFVTELYTSGILKERSMYVCPAKGTDNAAIDPKASPADFTDYMGAKNGKKSPYRLKVLLTQKKLPPRKVPLVWDKKGNHEGGRNVLFADGNVDFLTEEDFKSMMKDIKKK